MKRLFLSLLILASVSFTAFSHNHSGRRGNKGRMVKELNLTEEQQKNVKSLKEDFRAKIDTLRADKTLSRDEKREKRRELSLAKKEQFKSILTPEQQEKMKNSLDRGGRDFKKNGKLYSQKGRGRHQEFDAETKSKLKELKENLIKEKQAVEKSRIAPEVQKERIKSLEEKYREERREIVKNALKSNS